MSAPIIKINAARETKGFFIRVCFLGLATLGLLAFSMRSPADKTYKVELTLKGWQVAVDCLKQSQAPSATTNQLIDEISKQIQPILDSEQHIADSINKLKVKPKQ